MTDMNPTDPTFIICESGEYCIDGKPHDFKGWVDIKDEDGNIRGGTTVCTRCGLDAMTHSLRYGP